MQSQAVSDLLQNNPDGLFEALNGVLRAMLDNTSPAILDAGWALFWSLAVVLTVWTGLKRAFGGSWEMWEYWRLVVALIIPLTILGAYDQPLMLTAAIPITLPGSTAPLTFPELIVAQGNWIAAEVNPDGLEEFWEFARSLGFKLVDAVLLGEADGVSGWNPLNWPAMLESFKYTSATAVMVLGTLIVGLLAAVIGYAQLLFAQVAIAVCALLGPVFIPWILLQPMAFLFWGWFRTILTFGLYAAVAGAIFNVMLALLEGTTSRVLDEVDIGRILALPLEERAEAYADAGFWMVTLFVCSVACIVSFLKIPAIASGLVSGQAGGEAMGSALAAVGVAGGVAVKGAATLAGKAGGALRR